MHSAKLSEKRRHSYKFTGVAKEKLISLRLETFASIFNEVNLEMFWRIPRGAAPKHGQSDVARQIAKFDK